MSNINQCIKAYTLSFDDYNLIANYIFKCLEILLSVENMLQTKPHRFSYLLIQTICFL